MEDTTRTKVLFSHHTDVGWLPQWSVGCHRRRLQRACATHSELLSRGPRRNSRNRPRATDDWRPDGEVCADDPRVALARQRLVPRAVTRAGESRTLGDMAHLIAVQAHVTRRSFRVQRGLASGELRAAWSAVRMMASATLLMGACGGHPRSLQGSGGVKKLGMRALATEGAADGKPVTGAPGPRAARRSEPGGWQAARVARARPAAVPSGAAARTSRPVLVERLDLTYRPTRDPLTPRPREAPGAVRSIRARARTQARSRWADRSRRRLSTSTSACTIPR